MVGVEQGIHSRVNRTLQWATVTNMVLIAVCEMAVLKGEPSILQKLRKAFSRTRFHN